MLVQNIVTEEQEVCNWSNSREAGSVLISHHAPQHGQLSEQLIQIKTGDQTEAASWSADQCQANAAMFAAI